MSEDLLLAPIIVFIGTLGVAGFMGFIIGYALKKIGKVIAFTMGLFMLGLGILSYYGIVRVNWQRLSETVYNHSVLALNEAEKIVYHVGSQIEGQNMVIVSGGSFGFIAGLAYGVKKG